MPPAAPLCRRAATEHAIGHAAEDARDRRPASVICPASVRGHVEQLLGAHHLVDRDIRRTNHLHRRIQVSARRGRRSVQRAPPGERSAAARRPAGGVRRSAPEDASNSSMSGGHPSPGVRHRLQRVAVLPEAVGARARFDVILAATAGTLARTVRSEHLRASLRAQNARRRPVDTAIWNGDVFVPRREAAWPSRPPPPRSLEPLLTSQSALRVDCVAEREVVLCAAAQPVSERRAILCVEVVLTGLAVQAVVSVLASISSSPAPP